jgi:hypothetical protein
MLDVGSRITGPEKTERPRLFEHLPERSGR